MKKLLIICASFAALSLSSCGGSNNTDPSSTDSTVVDTTVTDTVVVKDTTVITPVDTVVVDSAHTELVK